MWRLSSKETFEIKSLGMLYHLGMWHLIPPSKGGESQTTVSRFLITFYSSASAVRRHSRPLPTSVESHKILSGWWSSTHAEANRIKNTSAVLRLTGTFLCLVDWQLKAKNSCSPKKGHFHFRLIDTFKDVFSVCRLVFYNDFFLNFI